ncbi:syncytin-2-like [Engystomops pustulosus]|uniref:syncytin-2-like n=1 Tax=Engystomops pustulosus TaxID=76066 RepID=UPI003AFB6962
MVRCKVEQGNYTCVSSDITNAKTPLGVFEKDFCQEIVTIDPDLLSDHTSFLYDVFWLCGNGKLRNRLPQSWRGQCALVKLVLPFLMLPWDPTHKNEQVKIKRSLSNTDYGQDPDVYIDSIGVPRGVPDRYKAQDQIAAGFASIIPQVQINKNVDWINYVYYNEQRFVNYSRDAFTSIVEELGPNTRMTLQNRMTLDMILAEKGGVYGMIGEDCCTYIPQNSGAGGKTLIAIKKITALATEMKENAGVDTSWAAWFTSWAGGWKALFQQIGLVLLGIFILALFLLCCCMPLYKKLAKKIANNKAKGVFSEYR